MRVKRGSTASALTGRRQLPSASNEGAQHLAVLVLHELREIVQAREIGRIQPVEGDESAAGSETSARVAAANIRHRFFDLSGLSLASSPPPKGI